MCAYTWTCTLKITPEGETTLNQGLKETLKLSNSVFDVTILPQPRLYRGIASLHSLGRTVAQTGL